MCLLAAFFLHSVAVADNHLKADLERTLVGKAVPSRVSIGSTAALRNGPGMQHPVSTLVYPDTSSVRYQVDSLFGALFVDKGDYRLNYFQQSQFIVEKLDFKNDRLELHLKPQSGDSVKLKVMLGKDWQKNLDASAVLAQIGSALNLDDVLEESQTVSYARSSQSPSSGEQSHSSTSLSPELIVESHGIAAALNTFQNNFGGVSGFLRNPQVKQPPVSHTISDLQKRLGKEMTPRDTTDVSAMAAAAENCVAYLSSPSLVSYMEPDVAQATRQTANNILRQMDAASTKITGADLRTVLVATKAYISQTEALAAKQSVPGQISPAPGTGVASNPSLTLTQTVALPQSAPQTATTGTHENPPLLNAQAKPSETEATSGLVSANEEQEVPPLDSTSADVQPQDQASENQSNAVTNPTPGTSAQVAPAADVTQYPQSSDSAKSSGDSGISFTTVFIVLGVVIVFVLMRKRAKRRRIEEEEDRREREFRQQVEHERASFRGEFKDVLDKFDAFTGLCEGYWPDFIEAVNSHEGTSHDSDSFDKLVNAEVLAILKRISSLTGDRVRCGKLYQAVFAQSAPYEYFSVAMCMVLIDRVKALPVKAPFVVEAFGGFPQVFGENGTVTFGRSAALAFKSLVVAAFGEPLSAEASALRQQYLVLLKPYISEDNARGGESSSSNRNDKRSTQPNPSCPECSESYSVLRLKPDASEREIKAAYRDLAQIYHPDRFNSSNDRLKQTAEGEMKRLNVAYEHIMEHLECAKV